MFNRKYIFKGYMFHCYVSFPEGILKQKISEIMGRASKGTPPNTTLQEIQRY